MEIGKLNERISFQTPTLSDPFGWEKSCDIWASCEQSDKPNLFSKVGIGARSVSFVIRKRSLSLHDAVLWRSKHCFLTSITDDGKMALKVVAALVKPVSCFAWRSVKTRNEYGTPEYLPQLLCSFTGFLTEKYQGFSQQEPQGVGEHRMVLTTPKAVLLKAGDTVKAGTQDSYTVRVCYLADEFKNEYEITDRKEP